MQSVPGTRLIHLDPGAFARLRNAKGRIITAVHGTVWITQENDTRDVVLEKYGSFTFNRDGIALAGALGGPALLAAEDGIIVEHLENPSLPASLDLSPGSAIYRRAHELRAQALRQLLLSVAAHVRCFSRNLFHRVGLPVQPC